MHAAQPQGAQPPPPPVRYKVLLVDDDDAGLRSLAAALEFELDIATCSSGERALALLGNGDFHVVCSDYSMGGMTGLELLQRVALLPVPVGGLLLTGSSSFISRHGAGVGDHYVLVKPVAPERLLVLILQLARTAEMKRSANRLDRAQATRGPKGSSAR